MIRTILNRHPKRRNHDSDNQAAAHAAIAQAAHPLVEAVEPRRLMAGDGLTGMYYHNENFTRLGSTRIDPTVNFNWEYGKPTNRIDGNTFSARWTGSVEAQFSETYTFHVTADDGVRLWVDGKLLIDEWNDHSATEFSGQIDLQAGKRYNIRLDYYENYGRAVAQLRWSSPSTPRQIIPTSQLYSTAAPANEQDGNTDTGSDPIQVPIQTAPAAPTNLKLSGVTNSQATLTWADNSDNETSFVVERSTNGTTYTTIATLGANVTSYTAGGLNANTTYYFRVAAENNVGRGISSAVSATTPASAAPVVTKLTLVNVDTQQDIMTLTDGTTIDLAKMPSRNLTIRADVSGTVESLRWGMNSNSNYRIENLAPYALAGDNRVDTLYAWNYGLGAYRLAATAFSADDAAGTASATHTVNFTILDSSANTPTNNTGGGTTTPTDNTTPTIPTGDATPPALPGNWNLIFQDEFNGTSLSSKWRPNIWNQTYYGPATVANGVLSLSATSANTPALITTNNSFSFKYGYAEARIKIPSGQGIWPAFWTLPMPASGENDGAGEIDILEVMGDTPTNLTTAYHVRGNHKVRDTELGFDMSQGYHVYAVNWQPDAITWYVDGKEVYKVTSAQATIVADPSYLILDVWLGGWHGDPDSTTKFPATMNVDYVRVWQT